MTYTWTKETPKVKGWYWEYNSGYSQMVEVYEWTYMPKDGDPEYRRCWWGNRLWVTPPHTRNHPEPVGEYFKDTWWAGPIELPKFKTDPSA